jgi:ferric-dicitrate binding protein FerR (iron transport regulator)
MTGERRRGSITLTRPHDITDAIAWRERRLVFRSETLE